MDLQGVLKRIGVASMLIFVSLTTWAETVDEAQNSVQPQHRFDSNSERLLELRLASGYKIRETILAFQFENALYLPVFEIGEALGFALEVADAQLAITGFLWSEEDRFELNLQSCELLRADGKKSHAQDLETCSLGRYFEGEIYVHRDTLEEWFRAEIEFNSLRSQILIQTLEPSPLERNLEARYMRDLVVAQNTQRSERDVAPSDADAAEWSNPQISYEAFFRTTQSSAASQANDFGLAGAGSFAVGEWRNQLLFQGANSGFSNPRYTLSKSGDAKRNIGPLNFRQLEAFDVHLPSIEGVLPSRGGKGLFISSRKKGTQFFGADTFLEGVTEANWVVELYQFGVLRDVVEADDRGYFVFKSVQLTSGENSFQIVARGPQGQSEVFRRNFSVDKSHPGSGNWVYEASLLQPSAESGNSDAEAALKLSYGLSDSIFMDASLLGFAEASDSTSVWGRFSLGAFRENLSPAINLVVGEGFFWEPTLRYVFLNNNVDLSYAHFNDFSSPVWPRIGENSIQRRWSLRSSSYFAIGEKAFTLRQEWAQKTYNLAEADESEWNAALLTSLWDTSMQLDYSLVQGVQTTWSVGYRLRKALDRAFLQAGVDLSPKDEGLADAWFAELSRNWEAGLSSRLAYSNESIATNEGRRQSVSFGVAQNFWGHEWYMNVSLGQNSWSSQIGLRSTLFFERQNMKLHFDSSADATSATARVTVCKDLNYDSICSHDEPRYPGVAIRLNNRSDKYFTDERGQVFLSGLIPDSDYEVRVDTVKLFEEDYDLKKYSYRISVDPGRFYTLEIAASPIAELDGYVECDECSASGGVANKKIVLVETESGEKHEVYTEFDGYFLFESLKPKPYQWYVDDGGERHSGIVRLEGDQRISTLLIRLP